MTLQDRKEGKLERSRDLCSGKACRGFLQTHPTIEVVLDLHRDGVADSVRLTEISMKAYGPDHVFQGMSRTPEGEIAYLPNPHLQENLAFLFSDAAGLWTISGICQKKNLPEGAALQPAPAWQIFSDRGRSPDQHERGGVECHGAVGRGGGYGARSGDAEIDMQEFTHAETTAIRSCKEPEKMIS